MSDPKEVSKWPPRLMVLFYNDGSYQIQGDKLLGGSKPYMSEEEHNAILKMQVERAELKTELAFSYKRGLAIGALRGCAIQADEPLATKINDIVALLEGE